LKILLTNDDGIYSLGLEVIHRELIKEHDITIIAPETEMSAVGHAITLTMPLRVMEIYKEGKFYGYAIRGTPADCVKIGVQELMAQRPDMIISGINLGANMGVNVLYSGTVSAATEGAFQGIPSVAISLNTRRNPDYSFAARFAKKIISFMKEISSSNGIALNINIPSLPPEKIRGVKITRQGMSHFEESYERRRDPRGNIYYWLKGERFVEDGDPNDDATAVSEGWISITPIHYDLTDEKEYERLTGLVSGYFK